MRCYFRAATLDIAVYTVGEIQDMREQRYAPLIFAIMLYTLADASALRALAAADADAYAAATRFLRCQSGCCRHAYIAKILMPLCRRYHDTLFFFAYGFAFRLLACRVSREAPPTALLTLCC